MTSSATPEELKLNRIAAVAVVAWSCAAAAAHAAMPSVDSAQSYPNRPLRLIAPFPPGGPTDIIGRVVAQKLGENLKQNIVVDNRGGGTGVIGMELAARSAPDGYTLVIGSSANLAVNPALTANLPYDTLRDFQPLTQTTSGPQILVVPSSLPAKSVQEFVALAKAKPGQLNYASGGSGTTTHLAAELFKLATGTDIVHVPYKGTGQALTDVISGQAQMMVSSLLPAMPHVKAGKLRGLAVTSTRRSSVLPDMPTVAESGLPGFETVSWHGMLVPAKTPKGIVARLHAELVKMLNQPDVKTLFASQGLETVGNSPEAFAAYIRNESHKWAKVIKTIGIRTQ